MIDMIDDCIIGLHLPNGHFFVDGAPLPAHLVTSCMYLWHNWQPCAAVCVPFVTRLSSAYYLVII
jgi:malate synthase